jgi:hypothetical protein
MQHTLTSPSKNLVGYADIESWVGWELVGVDVPIPLESNMNLYTQLDGTIFLLGTRSQLDTSINPFMRQNTSFIGQLDNVTKMFTAGFPPQRTGFTCLGSDFCDFDGAAGFYSDAMSDRIYLYSTSEFMFDNATQDVGVTEYGSSLLPSSGGNLESNVLPPNLQVVDVRFDPAPPWFKLTPAQGHKEILTITFSRNVDPKTLTAPGTVNIDLTRLEPTANVMGKVIWKPNAKLTGIPGTFQFDPDPAGKFSTMVVFMSNADTPIRTEEKHRLEATVKISGVRTPYGELLDGDKDGKPGGEFVTVVWRQGDLH